MYKKLFWGFLFLFDFRLLGFDILPDVIAYIFFYQGLTLLEEKNEFFKAAKKVAFPMIFISIFNIYEFNTGNTFLYFFSILLTILTLILSLVMVYNICRGIGYEARLINLIKLESKANSRWRLYLISIILTIIVTIIPISLLFFVVFAFAIVTYLLMLGLMYAASNQLTS